MISKQTQTDSDVTVQDQMIQMNPSFRSNRTFTRPNGTKFTHDIWIKKMVDWMTFILRILFRSSPYSHRIMSFHVSWKFVWIPYFFSSSFSFVVVHFILFRYRKVAEGVVHTKSNNINSNGKQQREQKRVSLIACHTVLSLSITFFHI